MHELLGANLDASNDVRGGEHSGDEHFRAPPSSIAATFHTSVLIFLALVDDDILPPNEI